MPTTQLSIGQWVSLVSCAGLLALSLATFLRGPRGEFGVALGLLCLDVFVWSLLEFARTVSGAPEWPLLGAAFSCLTPPLALHVVVGFVGRLRSLRRLLVAVYGFYVALAALAVAAFVSSTAERWVASKAWPALFLTGWLPLIALELALLVRHLRESHALAEQMRTRLALGSMAFGAVLGSAVMLDQVLFDGRALVPVLESAPALRHVAALGSMGLIAAAALRFRLLGRDLEASAALYSIAVAALAVLGYVLVFLWVGTRWALLVVTAASLTLGVFGAMRGVLAALADRRARLRELATLGRFSAQMAHDIHNPLAALKGALQLLEEELARGRSIDGRGRTLELAMAQTLRLEALVRKYRRLSSVQPVPTPVRVNALVERALGMAELEARTRSVRVRTEAHLEPSLPMCRADGDLLSSALENLMRNSLEALSQGGRLAVTTDATLLNGRACVRVAVEDDGDGMDARTAEQAFDDFFTTKPDGGGFGLAFVRRVAEMHGGDVRLRSSLGRGTRVELLIPVGDETEEQERGRTFTHDAQRDSGGRRRRSRGPDPR